MKEDEWGRNVLESGAKLRLISDANDDAKYKRTFIIDEIKSTKGASVVSYVAHYNEGAGFSGVLKEFYPVSKESKEDYLAYLKRENNQLLYDVEFMEKKESFEKQKNRYKLSYELLAKSDQKDILQKFILAFDIYLSDGGDTMYIWTPEPPLQTFEQVCDLIHKKPYKASERKLALILNAIYNLSVHIDALHRSNILHRDIKPANFGFLMDENDQTLTQTLKLFDVDSFCDFYDSEEKKKPIGTPGFMSPKIKSKGASINTDIYSIGATLFYALANTKRTQEKSNSFCYYEEYYEEIKDLVDTSNLIRFSDYNQNPELREILTKILKKCLYTGSSMDENVVYNECGPLIEDIKQALDYIPTTEMEFFGKKWALSDIDKEDYLLRERSIRAAAFHHIYKYPLYKGIKQWDLSNIQPVNILIVGFTYYCQRFLDVCLQALQMPNGYPSVTVLYDNPKDVENYKEDRRELYNFFEDNDSLVNKENYGTIKFRKYENLLEDFEGYKSECSLFCCIFIDIGKEMDEKNKELALKIREENKSAWIHYTDAFSLDGEKKIAEHMYVFNPHRWKPDKKMDNEAMNVHMIWNNRQVSYKTIEEEYKKPYNYYSCISYVLSIKYKLYGIGIDIDKITAKDAANAFYNKIQSEELTDKMMYYEHRRWVVDRICEGWERKNIEECKDGITSDNDRRKHVCIVKGEQNQNLYNNSRNNHKIWDDSSINLESYDELDRMSIELHRSFTQWASESKKSNVYQKSIELIETIVERLNKKEEIRRIMQDWKTCMVDIRENGKQRVGSYDSLRERFLSLIMKFNKDRYDEIAEVVGQLDRFYKPILLSQKYIDYKRHDVDLIKAIPFIMTNNRIDTLIVPIDANKTSSANYIFKYIVSGLVLRPRKIKFLLLNKGNEIDSCKDTITRFFTKKNLLEDENINWIIKDTPKEIIKEITKLDDCVLENNDTDLSKIIHSNEQIKRKARYEIKLEKGEVVFENLNKVDFLQYIKCREHLDVAEVIMLGGGKNIDYKPPEFYDYYDGMWKWYRSPQNHYNWKKICQVLCNYHNRIDNMIRIRKDNGRNNKYNMYEFVMPIECKKAVEKILIFLLDEEVISNDSRIEVVQSNTILLHLSAKSQYDRTIWEELFYPSHRLFAESLIYCYAKKEKGKGIILYICYQNLCINKNFNLKNVSDENYGSFIQKTKEMNLISNIKGKCFSYTSINAKDIMTKGGRLLEVYLYHELKESGKFNDIVCGYSIYSSQYPIPKEIDIILTKGFKTAFIECKARSEIKEEYYPDLKGLERRYGINGKAILVVDIGQTELTDEYKEIVERNEKQGVITIWKPEEIENISDTIEKCLNS